VELEYNGFMLGLWLFPHFSQVLFRAAQLAQGSATSGELDTPRKNLVTDWREMPLYLAISPPLSPWLAAHSLALVRSVCFSAAIFSPPRRTSGEQFKNCGNLFDEPITANL
jgi:hypothetical protein